MEKKIVVSKRFRNNSLRIYQYLQLRFSSKTAFLFLDKLEERITFIINHPEAGKVSEKRNDVRSILFTPYNRIYYRIRKNKVTILCLFDMRKNPSKKPY